MKKLIKFGEDVEGYNIPVLNEREIRAAAGLLFLATFTSLMYILFKGNFVPIKYVIIIFLADFLIRVFINPRFSPTLILGTFDCQEPDPGICRGRSKEVRLDNRRGPGRDHVHLFHLCKCL